MSVLTLGQGGRARNTGSVSVGISSVESVTLNGTAGYVPFDAQPLGRFYIVLLETSTLEEARPNG